MRRSTPLLTLMACGVAAVAAIAWVVVVKRGVPEIPARPNIIFIMADDLGYGELGCYGQTEIQTPHIDSLAAEGMRFTQCYAGSPVCAPSRSVLMTGLHTGHTTVRGNLGIGGVTGLGGGPGRIPLMADDVTVADVLKNAGYVTGMTGKWGLGEPNTSGEPNRQGFDEWFGYLNQRRAHSYYPTYLWRNRERVPLEGNTTTNGTHYSHDLFTDFALSFIRDNQDKPFFLYVPYCIPHTPFVVPDTAPYADKPWSADAVAHAAQITRMDRDIGRIIALLKELAIDERTVVFFCSDNGAANRWDNLFDSSGHLRGRKRDVYEGGIRVPMIVRWPDVIPPGIRSDLLWGFQDVLPTLADMADTQAPARLDGTSVLPTLLGREQDLSDRFLYWEFFERGFQQAGRWRKWKVVRHEPGWELELFDLTEDPSEQANIAREHPDVIACFEDYMRTARSESDAWPTPGKSTKSGNL